MAHYQSIDETLDSQPPPGLLQIRDILNSIDATKLIARLQAYRWTGRRGYPLTAMWRAYVASFILNLGSTNDLIRRLEDDLEIRLLCGFSSLPHRTTFNRFIRRLEAHRNLVEECMVDLTDRLADALPGFGEKVAVDSTVVRTHSNPNRKMVSDRDASWTRKNDAGSKDGEPIWHFGHKYHVIVDATYDLPIYGCTTTASFSDMRTLTALLDTAAEKHRWFQPEYVIGDKGYDSEDNHRDVLERDSIPIISIRDMPKKKLREGIYTNDGTPTCMGMVPMQYVRTDPEKGHLYRCDPDGCHLRDRKGVRYCQDQTWENRTDKPRIWGPVRRGSELYKVLYRMRYSVERFFKSAKESRRLEKHYIRGNSGISIHAAMSALVCQATAYVHVQAGDLKYMRWQVRRVA